jgi:glucokinase
MRTMGNLRLIGDIGGTNARFAIAQDGRFDHLRILHTGDFPSLAEAIRSYLLDLPAELRPTLAAVAVAGPVSGDHVALTNQNWSFSIVETGAGLGLAELLILNDFAAASMAIPFLTPADLMPVGRGSPVAGGPIVMVGPGTGLGMAALIPAPDGWLQLASEGGHATMPPTDDEESRILDLLRRRHGHVSAERVLSGQGLTHLYEAVCGLAGQPAGAREPAAITAAALAGTDRLAGRALDLFCAMLGTVAGNLALTLCATGGTYIAGGILPRIKERLAASEFRARFEAKGRLAAYLATIPTWLVTHEFPAFLGLANLDAFAPGPPRR